MSHDEILNRAINEAYEDDQALNPHISSTIGAGTIGDPCARKLFIKFRWMDRSGTFGGKMLRLFDRGQREEAVFIEHLNQIGVKVIEEDPATGKQFRINYAEGHGKGFLDGIGTNISQWLLDTDDDEPVLLEFKTYNDKRFKALQKNGVKKNDIKYHAQCIMYMDGFELKYCLFCAVNKNTDELYFEVIPADEAEATRYKDRGRLIAFSESMPAKIGNGQASWYECKFCDYRAVCHTNKLPEVNCRTCAFSTVADKGRILCEHPTIDAGWKGKELNLEVQNVGCTSHAFHPALVEHSMLEYAPEHNTETSVAYKLLGTDSVLFNSGTDNILSTDFAQELVKIKQALEDTHG